jgi:phage regulator Rha-like protein
MIISNKMENLILKQTITSREIAEVASKNHKDVIRSIRNMEVAWNKICKRKFALTYDKTLKIS